MLTVIAAALVATSGAPSGAFAQVPVGKATADIGELTLHFIQSPNGVQPGPKIYRCNDGSRFCISDYETAVEAGLPEDELVIAQAPGMVPIAVTSSWPADEIQSLPFQPALTVDVRLENAGAVTRAPYSVRVALPLASIAVDDQLRGSFDTGCYEMDAAVDDGGAAHRFTGIGANAFLQLRLYSREQLLYAMPFETSTDSMTLSVRVPSRVPRPSIARADLYVEAENVLDGLLIAFQEPRGHGHLAHPVGLGLKRPKCDLKDLAVVLPAVAVGSSDLRVSVLGPGEWRIGNAAPWKQHDIPARVVIGNAEAGAGAITIRERGRSMEMQTRSIKLSTRAGKPYEGLFVHLRIDAIAFDRWCEVDGRGTVVAELPIGYEVKVESESGSIGTIPATGDAIVCVDDLRTISTNELDLTLKREGHEGELMFGILSDCYGAAVDLPNFSVGERTRLSGIGPGVYSLYTWALDGGCALIGVDATALGRDPGGSVHTVSNGTRVMLDSRRGGMTKSLRIQSANGPSFQWPAARSGLTQIVLPRGEYTVSAEGDAPGQPFSVVEGEAIHVALE